METVDDEGRMVAKLCKVEDRDTGQLLPTTSPSCGLCTSQQSESVLHALFECDKNREAAQYLVLLVKIYDASCTPQKALRLNFHTDALYELPTILMLSTGLEYIWTNRSQKKSTNLFMIRTELELLVCLLRKSRPKKLREAGAIIENTLENFPIW